MTKEGRRPTQVTPENPISSTPSPELIQELSQRIQLFAHSTVMYCENGSVVIYKQPNSVEIKMEEVFENRDLWQELRRDIPAEVLVFEDRDLGIQRESVKDRRYTITLGQTKHAAIAGLHESSEEISIWADNAPNYFKIHEDGKITKRSKFAKDINPNPEFDPWDNNSHHAPLMPIKRVPESDVLISEVEALELNRLMDRFDEMAKQGNLRVDEARYNVSGYIAFS